MEKKKKALTERQELFLDKLTGEANGDLRTAMTMAGYSRSYTPDTGRCDCCSIYDAGGERSQSSC